MADAWSEAIDRMLARIQDTAPRVKDLFPHWADPETGQWQTTLDMLFSTQSYLANRTREAWIRAATGGADWWESLLGPAGRIDPLRV